MSGPDRKRARSLAVLVAAVAALAAVVGLAVGTGSFAAPQPAPAKRPVLAEGEPEVDVSSPVDGEPARTPAVRDADAAPTPASDERAALVLRGSLVQADGRPCPGAPIHRAIRGASWKAAIIRLGEASSDAASVAAGVTRARRLGATAADGAFAIALDEALGEDEWIEFDLGPAAFARFRPDAAAREVGALMVPAFAQTTVEVHGLDAGETWELNGCHPTELQPDGQPVLHAVIDVPCQAPGELVLRCRFSSSADLGARETLSLPLSCAVGWNVAVRASKHTITEPSRDIAAGERVVFEAGPLEQRIVVAIVDAAGRAVPVDGRVELHAERGYALGPIEDGRAELRPPFGRQRLEGDLRLLCVLEDGETFSAAWPEAVWIRKRELTLRRGDGRMAIDIDFEVDVGPGGIAVEAVRGQSVTGDYRAVAEPHPPFLNGPSWWEPTAVGLRVCVPDDVARLWCVARTDGQARVGVAERVGPRAFRFAWRQGRPAELQNDVSREGLLRIVVQCAIPGIAGRERWLTIARVEADAFAPPLRVFRPDGLACRVKVIRSVDGRPRSDDQPAAWR